MYSPLCGNGRGGEVRNVKREQLIADILRLLRQADEKTLLFVLYFLLG